MEKLRSITILFFLMSFTAAAHSQDCSCTVSEVHNNTVSPCELIIGTIDTVTNAAVLRLSIINANNTGGDMTILIADGTYQIATTSWYPYITASNVVFRGLSGNRDNVILSGTGMRSVTPQVENGFYIVGDNVTIADLTIMEVGNHGIAGEGDNMFVHNVKIQNTYEQMIKGTSAGDGADNGKVQCSLFEYTAGVGPWYYIGGLDIHEGSNWVVNDNIFRNIASPSQTQAEHAVHFWNFSSDNIVERNEIYNCDRGIGFGLGSSPNEGGIIRNNMIYNDGTGTYDDVGIGLESSPGTKVYNNTIHIQYQNAIEYRFVETTNVDIANNLTNKPIRSRNDGEATLTTNYTSALDNWFANLTEGNLRLTYDSNEIIDQGTPLTEITVDIDKELRNIGTDLDIGADEYSELISSYSAIESTMGTNVFPNPASEKVTIQSNEDFISEIKIYDLLGNMLSSYKDLNSARMSIDIIDWQAGIYICNIINTNHKSESQVFTIIK